jgi:hypothetical protein
MKILESKRSEIGIITEFRRIPNGFPNLAINSSSSSDSDVLEMYGGNGATLRCISTGLTDLTDSLLASPTFSEEEIFAADGGDIDNDMPTDAEASKYSFLDCLECYMEQALISESTQGCGACNNGRGRHKCEGDGSNEEGFKI